MERFQSKRGFSMIELVIVMVIIGVLGSIAALRANNIGGNADEVALEATIVTLQKSLEHYAVEHRGMFPDVSTMASQLTQFTDVHGNISATKTGQFVYGPYIRQMPKNLSIVNPARDENSNSSVGDNVVDIEFDISTGSMTVFALRGSLKTRDIGKQLVRAKLVDSISSLGL